MSLAREILEETRRLDESKVKATFYNANEESEGKAGQVSASFIAISDQGDTVYHKMIDWCDSMEDLKEYSGVALGDLVEFIDTTDYFIEEASVSVLGLSSVIEGTSKNMRIIGSWDIYRDGEYTEELDFAKEALGYDNR